MTALDIAIVGAAGRFPGAPDLRAFWRNLRDGIDSISRWPESEPGMVGAAGLIEHYDCFDAEFFDYSPKEARLLDPQHRVFLECGVQALENAAIDPDRFDGRIGVYASASLGGYLLHNVFGSSDVDAPFDLLLSNDKDFLATRLSYKLNLCGPGVMVQTACSSSLVAVHFACLGLLGGDCDAAVAGGVTVRAPHRSSYRSDRGMIFSPDGYCRPFDRRAAGSVPGNGVGIVTLMRLEDALRTRHSILAVIRGTAINNDGHRKPGYTAPQADGQSAAIALAMAAAGAVPRDISFVETHGSGTPLGDLIEVSGLKKAYGAKSGQQWCAIGSVKSNIGHLDAASGIAGLLKAALSLHHRAIPPSLHCDDPNPELGLEGSPFYVNRALRPWPDSQVPMAGVSSFGIGGTNAHVVLAAAPERIPSSSRQRVHAMPVSARSAEALTQSTRTLAEALGDGDRVALADAARTLQSGRRQDSYRTFAVARARDEAAAALRRASVQQAAWQTGDPIVFAFPGLGNQSAGMARELYAAFPVFRETTDRCADFLRTEMAADVREYLLTEPIPITGDRIVRRSAPAAEAEAAEVAHPALFVTEYALVQLWASVGVRPSAVVGFSLGEYVAACVAGVLSVEDMLRLVVRRARLVDSLPPGAMLAVALGPEELQRHLPHDVEVAAFCGRFQTVVAGDALRIETLRLSLTEQAIACQPLRTRHAFHSTKMTDAAAAMAAQLADMRLQQRTLPVLSNVTGDWASEEEMSVPEYWTRHLMSPIRWEDSLSRIWSLDHPLIIEVGPGTTLTALALQHQRSAESGAVATLPYPDAQESGFVSAVARAWAHGFPVQWEGLESADGGEDGAALAWLPESAFRRERHWIEPRSTPQGDRTTDIATPPSTDVRIASTPGDGRSDSDVLHAVRSMFEWVLGHTTLPAGKSFFELGGDSLVALKFVNGIRSVFEVDVTLHILRDHATPEQFASWLEGRLGERASDTTAGAAAGGAPQTLGDDDGDSRFRLAELTPCWNDAALSHVLRAFKRLRLFTEPRQTCGVDELPFRPAHRKLARRWLDALCERRLLENTGDAYRAIAALPDGSAQTFPASGGPGYHAIASLLQNTGEGLVDILEGRLDASHLAFAGDPPVAVRAYRDIAEAQFCLRTATSMAGSFLSHVGSTPAILEVGGGLALTTAALRPALPVGTRYVFSDVSPVFLRYGQAALPGAVCQLYDIDTDPVSSGLSPDSFDLIVASNVLHCAKSIATSLSYLRSLLKVGGRLLLVEATRNELWHTLTMGLLEGFLHFEDDRLSTGLTLLSRDQWVTRLETAGMKVTAMEPATAEESARIGQHVIVAERE